MCAEMPTLDAHTSTTTSGGGVTCHDIVRMAVHPRVSWGALMLGGGARADILLLLLDAHTSPVSAALKMALFYDYFYSCTCVRHARAAHCHVDV